jgi:hypothetical protein
MAYTKAKYKDKNVIDEMAKAPITGGHLKVF